jgi:hypothetical protein
VCSLNVPKFIDVLPTSTEWEDGDEDAAARARCAEGCWTHPEPAPRPSAPGVATLQCYDVMAKLDRSGPEVCIGSARVNRDGTIAVRFNPIPVNGHARLVPAAPEKAGRRHG